MCGVGIVGDSGVGGIIDCTRKWIGNAAYIVYVTSLAILCTVTAREKLAGVTNDKESVLL